MVHKIKQGLEESLFFKGNSCFIKDRAKMLSYREKELLYIISMQMIPITTRKIYQLANMAKATALKHLAVLEATGLIHCIHIGPTKLWKIVERCPKCDAIMEITLISQCPKCNKKKK